MPAFWILMGVLVVLIWIYISKNFKAIGKNFKNFMNTFKIKGEEENE